jgi:hypothetical protein
MFANALEKARQFTRPIFQSRRYYDGSTEGGVMACVFVNSAGWFVTAAHALDAFLASQQHAPLIAEYEAGEAQIKANLKLKSKQRHRQIRSLRANDKWITKQSVVVAVGPSLATIAEWRADRVIDFAAGRVEPFDPTWITEYPIFKNASALRQGTSLCRLGYPFIPVQTTYDEAKNVFDLKWENLAFFPNEGILTREVFGQQSPNGPFTVRFIETSSAGLRGQSGGPVVDTRGVVWGIQAHTEGYELGFPPKLRVQTGKEVEVYQFMNVGRAVHPLTIHEFLTHEGVDFAMEPAGGMMP